ncbi:hypothetical protein C7S15_4931 [Burkholderia cepacia]|nr:hypothetical protein [Burkholderia cepacia]
MARGRAVSVVPPRGRKKPARIVDPGGPARDRAGRVAPSARRRPVHAAG